MKHAAALGVEPARLNSLLAAAEGLDGRGLEERWREVRTLCVRIEAPDILAAMFEDERYHRDARTLAIIWGVIFGAVFGAMFTALVELLKLWGVVNH